MRCEIIAIGTELLLGQIVDTNSTWLGQELALAGIDSVHQSKVGDNLERIIGSIRLALGRSDAVILCGGLGPTQDDITREAIAEVMGVSLVRDDEVGEKIRELFTSRGREMTQNNLRQADRPEGTSLIPEMPGTAPGLICPINDQVIYAVPGVPHEMKTMVKGTVISDLKSRAGFTSVIRSRVLKTWGRTESGLAEMLADRIRELDQLGTATLAFQASGIEGLKVRITVKATDEESANAVIANEEKCVRHILGDCVFGIDDETMESVVLDLLRERSMHLAVAELVTGGLVGARLAAVPMAKEVLTGTMVAYSKDLAATWFEIPPGPIVSREAVMAMANGVRQALDAEVGLAVTGVASPGESSDLPVGTVFFGLAIGDQIDAVSAAMPGDRNRIREYSVINLLNFLRRELLFGDRKQYKK
jgi:nicotinamide-nucleotide amidase